MSRELDALIGRRPDLIPAPTAEDTPVTVDYKLRRMAVVPAVPVIPPGPMADYHRTVWALRVDPRHLPPPDFTGDLSMLEIVLARCPQANVPATLPPGMPDYIVETHRKRRAGETVILGSLS